MVKNLIGVWIIGIKMIKHTCDICKMSEAVSFKKFVCFCEACSEYVRLHAKKIKGKYKKDTIVHFTIDGSNPICDRRLDTVRKVTKDFRNCTCIWCCRRIYL